eukprot:TRINITY_DN59124_c0_g1_i1.p1 TRINITY_DN59124_c0_g1~~TRINITY_DN59124_c0_g1_i1.p1  ORF type:complete len:695 (-),score=203.01 TRINITY_DN59124_c0_g1_i1:420-2504(-)
MRSILIGVGCVLLSSAFRHGDDGDLVDKTAKPEGKDGKDGKAGKDGKDSKGGAPGGTEAAEDECKTLGSDCQSCLPAKNKSGGRCYWDYGANGGEGLCASKPLTTLFGVKLKGARPLAACSATPAYTPSGYEAVAKELSAGIVEDYERCKQDLKEANDWRSSCTAALLRQTMIQELDTDDDQEIMSSADCAVSGRALTAPVCCLIKASMEFKPKDKGQQYCGVVMPGSKLDSRGKGFKALRQRKDVSDLLLAEILAGPFETVTFDAGKSSSTFMKTANQRFLIKNIMDESAMSEAETLLRLLKGSAGQLPLVEHIKQGPSILGLVYGLYEVTLQGKTQTYIIMEDASMGIRGTGSGICGAHQYSLKGDQQPTAQANMQKVTGGDAEFADFRTGRGNDFLMSPKDCSHLAQTLRRDTAWLSSYSIAGYSLFVKFGWPAKNCDKNNCQGNEAHCFQTTAEEIAGMSLIDYLTAASIQGDTLGDASAEGGTEEGSFSSALEAFVSAACPTSGDLPEPPMGPGEGATEQLRQEGFPQADMPMDDMQNPWGMSNPGAPIRLEDPATGLFTDFSPPGMPMDDMQNPDGGMSDPDAPVWQEDLDAEMAGGGTSNMALNDPAPLQNTEEEGGGGGLDQQLAGTPAGEDLAAGGALGGTQGTEQEGGGLDQLAGTPAGDIPSSGGGGLPKIDEPESSLQQQTR